jgi:putative copper resistance protein D
MLRPKTEQPSRALVPGVVAAGCALAAVLLGTAFVTVTPIPGLLAPGDGVRFGLPAAKAALNLTGVATIAFVMAPLLGSAERAVWRRCAAVSSAVWFVAALVSLCLHTAELQLGRPIGPSEVADYATTVTTGQALLAVLAGTLAMLGCALLSVHRPAAIPAELRLILAFAVLLPLPVTGHSESSATHGVTAPMMLVHVVAAAGWLGGLFAVLLGLAANPASVVTTLPRFSKIATGALAGTAVTGLVLALLQLLSKGFGPTGLVTTQYGLLSLAKLACLGAAAYLGAHIRFRLMPTMADGDRSAVTRWATAEIGLLAFAFGLGTVLARTPVPG